MDNRVVKSILITIISLIFSSCSISAEDKVKVILEEGDYTCANHTLTLDKGSDFIFDVTLPIDKVIAGASYSNYSIKETNNDNYRYDKITFHHVMYSTVISLEISEGIKIKYVNDDVVKEEYAIKSHERINTSNDYNTFKKSGYAFIGWTNEDEIISLGSRASVNRDLTLTALYQKESDISLFEYNVIDSSRVEITKYLGDENIVTIPNTIEEKNVISVKQEAFKNVDIDTLILPRSLNTLEAKAFNNCEINSLIFFDNLVDVSNDSFYETSINKVRINSINLPAYSHSYYATYADKVDRLITLKDEKKIVLYSGSSTRFGFDSSLIDMTFLDYSVVNMGVFAYTQSMSQVEVISNFVNENDIVIVSPEFDAIDDQINLRKTFDYNFINMVEANFDILTYLDFKEYSNFFSSFKEFQMNRRYLKRYPYSDSPSSYDEDGNYTITPSYNRYGDYALFREDNVSLQSFGIKRAFYNKKYFLNEYISNFNLGYTILKDKGATLYYDYSPRMDISISEDSNSDTIEELGEYLKENIDMTFISSISDSLMSPLYFYKTDNHLSTSGVDIRTRRVISALLAVIKD